jgi:site-specific DNA-methyltransferase (adenine-specific)
MKQYLDVLQSAIYLGDNLQLFKKVRSESVDLIPTDPPYGLEFMGADWDKTLPKPEAWRECYRVLKPGGSLLAMSAARTDLFWRVCRDIEEAGFTLAQHTLFWIYKTGFPKGADLSKQADERAGAQRQVIGSKLGLPGYSTAQPKGVNGAFEGGGFGGAGGTADGELLITAPATELAMKLDGLYTKGKIKPAAEPIIWAMKPYEPGLLPLDNVVKHGVGAVNCLACMLPFAADERIEFDAEPTANNTTAGFLETVNSQWVGHNSNGRFPANILCTGQALGAECSRFFDIDAWARKHGLTDDQLQNAAAGIIDIPKPDEADRNFGCLTSINRHKTVKPIALFAYLISLLAPAQGIVLDPYCGSGTSPVAAVLAGRTGIGFELEETSYQTSAERLHTAINLPLTTEQQAGQGTLFD